MTWTSGALRSAPQTLDTEAMVRRWSVDEWYPNERHLGFIEEASGGYRMTFADRDIKHDLDVALAEHPGDLQAAIDAIGGRYWTLDFKPIS